MKFFLTRITLILLSLAAPLALASQSIQFQLTGASETAKTNITAQLAALEQSYGQTLSQGDIQAIYTKSPAIIRQALQPLGYFRAVIFPKGLEFKDNHWVAHFYIHPGSALPVTAVDIRLSGEGKNNPALMNLINHFPIKPGMTFQAENYTNAKNLLFQTAYNQGYLKASLTQKEIQINLQRYTAVIILHMETGSRYYFGDVHFNETPFASAFLDRFISFQQNEPFSSKKLLKFQQDLNNSRYFKDVNVTPLMQQTSDKRIPIQVDLSVPKAKVYKFGVGYGTFTGPRATLGMEWRRLGTMGHHFISEIKLSPVLSGIAAKYFIPGKNPLTDQFTIGVNGQKFVPKNGRSISETLSFSYVKTLSDWQHTLSLNYLIDRYRVDNDPSEVSRLLYPSYSLTHIKMDNMITPTSGHAVTFTLQGSSENILSSTSFGQGEMKGKIIWSPTDASRIMLRGDLGYTVVNDLARLPLTLNFFAGGVNSIRGFPDSSIGPGRYLEIASIEYQHRIIGDWSGAVFYDVGNATNHFNDPLNRGAGVGLVYNSAIGPIQVYLARAESKPQKPYQVEFSIGPQF